MSTQPQARAPLWGRAVSRHGATRLHVFVPSDAPPQLTVGIHEALKKAILEGRLRPSERINQEQIARELGVSRTPVRDGLVDLQPRRGAFVSAFDERDVFEIYNLRELLEPHAAARACLLATPADVAALLRLER